MKKKISWFDFCDWYSLKTKIRIVLVNERNFSDSNISTNRFQLIQKYLLFNDNNAAGTNEGHLYKIRTILDIVVNNFRTNCVPYWEISLDEVCLFGGVVCNCVCITQAKLQSTAYWDGWFVKVQLDIFVTCIFMMVCYIMLPFRRIILIPANHS